MHSLIMNYQNLSPLRRSLTMNAKFARRHADVQINPDNSRATSAFTCKYINNNNNNNLTNIKYIHIVKIE